MKWNMEKILYFASTKDEGLNEPIGKGQVKFSLSDLIQKARIKGYIRSVGTRTKDRFKDVMWKTTESGEARLREYQRVYRENKICN